MTRQGTLWDDDSDDADPECSDPFSDPQDGCQRCLRVACPIRRHDRRDPMWGECWHAQDRAIGHAIGDHRDCLAGDAVPLPDSDPHGLNEPREDSADACQWAARWRAAALELAATLPEGRGLGVVLLDPARGAVPQSSHASYRTAGPARTRAGRRPGDSGYAASKSRAVVVCTVGHLH
jgi:hypothetical protein